MFQLTCSMTTRNNFSEWEDQGSILKDLFQNALVNDSEQLFNLQKIFLAPSQKTSAGPLCVKVEVSVGEVINSNSEGILPAFYCVSPYYNKSCIPYTQEFELVPSDGTTTLASFLRTVHIATALATLDPSYYTFISILNNDIGLVGLDTDYLPDNNYCGDIKISVDQIETMPSEADVTDALSVTLSWVSCLLYTSPSPRDATLSRMPSSA